MSRQFFALLGSAFVLGAAGPAFANGNNNAAPAGAILDLGGGETGTAAQSVNHGAPVAESVTFTATQTNTDVTFAFREDPAFISFTDPSIVDDTTSSSNLFVNGDFSGGSYTAPSGNTIPTGWSYANIYGAYASGNLVGSGVGAYWYDGSVQAYDAIDQVVATTVGQTYTISFDYTDNSDLTTFSDLSTNGDTTDTGGNGIDILVYAQAGLPTACTAGTICAGAGVPEPATLSLLGVGLLGLIGLHRRRVGRGAGSTWQTPAGVIA